MHGLGSSRQSIDQLLLGTLQPLATQLRQLFGVGLSAGQSMQNAQSADAQYGGSREITTARKLFGIRDCLQKWGYPNAAGLVAESSNAALRRRSSLS